MNNIILQGFEKTELIQELRDEILLGVKSLLQLEKQKNLNSKEWLTVREVSDLLKISTVTVHAWSKKGILHKHRINSRIRFRKDEVLESLRAIEAKKR